MTRGKQIVVSVFGIAAIGGILLAWNCATTFVKIRNKSDLEMQGVVVTCCGQEWRITSIGPGEAVSLYVRRGGESEITLEWRDASGHIRTWNGGYIECRGYRYCIDVESNGTVRAFCRTFDLP